MGIHLARAKGKLKAKSICYFLKLHKRKADILHVYQGLLRWSHLPMVNQTRERDSAQLRLRVLMAAMILHIPRGRTKKGLRRCCEACVVCTPLTTNGIVTPILKHICRLILYSVFKQTFCFRIVPDWQKSCKDSPRSCCISYKLSTITNILH